MSSDALCFSAPKFPHLLNEGFVTGKPRNLSGQEGSLLPKENETLDS